MVVETRTPRDQGINQIWGGRGGNKDTYDQTRDWTGERGRYKEEEDTRLKDLKGQKTEQ